MQFKVVLSQCNVFIPYNTCDNSLLFSLLDTRQWTMPRKSPSIINQLFTYGEGKKNTHPIGFMVPQKIKKTNPNPISIKISSELNII